MHFFYLCLHLYLKKKGGRIFGDHNLPSGDQKFILDCQLAPEIKQLISDPGHTNLNGQAVVEWSNEFGSFLA